jgi:hypothetical protein
MFRPQFLAVCVLLSGCSTAQPSPAEATRLLQARFASLPPPKQIVRIYRAKCVEKNFEDYPIQFIEDTQTARQYRLLAEAGFATEFTEEATTERCGTLYPLSLRIIGITLTPKGTAQRWPEHHEREGGWDLPLLLRREFIAVTNIERQVDPALARVAYAWRLMPTPAGLALEQSDATRDANLLLRRGYLGWQIAP